MSCWASVALQNTKCAAPRLLLLPQALLPEGSEGEGEVSSQTILTVGSVLPGLSQQLFILLCG